ncbi:MAG TPA: potassium channel family protein [Ktedonobacterales bacterium]|nr:potassium channel family protein [Ktedonobacterales bacterium]
MGVVAAVFGLFLILAMLQDGFESIVLPRRVNRRLRLSRLFYFSAWRLWLKLAGKVARGTRREAFLGVFGPLSLIVLLGTWASMLVLGWGLVLWGLGIPMVTSHHPLTLGTYLYFSGVTFVTLGYGDVVPLGALGKLVAVAEAGSGFAFLALVIGYVPVIYQAFSRREVVISTLDARAGSPPSAAELLRRHYRDGNAADLAVYLREWERWCAEVLESHLSYPVLTYYRSQHQRQSWLGALTTVMDVCALLQVGFDGAATSTARFTFAIARHAAVDLAQVFGATPHTDIPDRLSSADYQRVLAVLAEVGLQPLNPETTEQRLRRLRRIYEPFVYALGQHLGVALPPWITSGPTVDDWQTSAWDHFTEWSPATIAEIAQTIAARKMKLPATPRAFGELSAPAPAGHQVPPAPANDGAPAALLGPRAD